MEFSDEVGKISQLVIGHRISIDTIQVLLKRPLSVDDMRKLRRLNPAMVAERTKLYEYPWLIRVIRPSRQSLRFIASVSPDHIVNRCDIALDFLTRLPDAAFQLQRFLKQHVTQPWRGRRRYTEHKSTAYFGLAWQRRSMVIYRKAAENRARLEIRLFCVATCRRYEVADCKALLRHDLASIIRRNSRISELDWEKVARRVDRRISATMRAYGESRTKVQRRVEAHMSRCLQTENCLPRPSEFPSLPVQAWIDYLPSFVKGAVRTLPIDALINASGRITSRQPIDT